MMVTCTLCYCNFVMRIVCSVTHPLIFVGRSWSIFVALPDNLYLRFNTTITITPTGLSVP